VSERRIYVLVGAIAIAAGAALWLGSRVGGPATVPSQVSPSALFAATFADTHGAPGSLGRYQGKILVLNFWATWCAPCRDEMPAFTRLQSRWAGRGVQFVGVSNEEPRRVERFGRDLGINYPLWVGGDEVGELARRLGNRLGVLPFTVLIDRQGNVLEVKVGPYSESNLESRLMKISAN
jgi:thiol-disulfide isomerase/thioredoxin